MKFKLFFAAIGLLAICSAFATRETRANLKYRVIQITTVGSNTVYEVVATDISGLTQGSFPGQYTCDAPTSEKCTVTIDEFNSAPDGYLDPPTNSRPYFISTSAKVVSSQDGVFNLH